MSELRFGRCSYLIENDAADPGGPTDDTNSIVVIKATGQFDTAARQVHVGFTRSLMETPPASLTSTGIGLNLKWSGAANEMNGNNWVPPPDDESTTEYVDNSACGAGTGPQYGIAVPDSTQQQDLKDATAPDDWDAITGKAPSAPWDPSTLSIGVDNLMTQGQLEALGDSLIAQADMTYTPGTEFKDVTISTQAAPKIHAVDCTGYDPTKACLKLDGTAEGAGVLVVKNGKLHLRATSSWIGLIIVVGQDVSFDTGGGGGPGNIIYGAVYVGENAAATDMQYRPRNTKLRYSCDALAVADAAAGGGLFGSGGTQGTTLWWKEAS